MKKKLILFKKPPTKVESVNIKIEAYADGIKLVSVTSDGGWRKDILALTPDGVTLFDNARDAGIAVESKKSDTVKVLYEF